MMPTEMNITNGLVKVWWEKTYQDVSMKHRCDFPEVEHFDLSVCWSTYGVVFPVELDLFSELLAFQFSLQ
jgi:hypothetical protein